MTVVGLDGLASAHLAGAGEAEGRDGGGPGGQGREGGGEAGGHGGLGEHVVRDWRPGLAAGRGVNMSGRAGSDDGRNSGVHHPAPSAPLVLQGGDLVEDVCQGLVLGTPVQQVVPVVAARYFLLTVHDAETLKYKIQI